MPVLAQHYQTHSSYYGKLNRPLGFLRAQYTPLCPAAALHASRRGRRHADTSRCAGSERPSVLVYDYSDHFVPYEQAGCTRCIRCLVLFKLTCLYRQVLLFSVPAFCVMSRAAAQAQAALAALVCARPGSCRRSWCRRCSPLRTLVLRTPPPPPLARHSHSRRQACCCCCSMRQCTRWAPAARWRTWALTPPRRRCRCTALSAAAR